MSRPWPIFLGRWSANPLLKASPRRLRCSKRFHIYLVLSLRMKEIWYDHISRIEPKLNEWQRVAIYSESIVGAHQGSRAHGWRCPYSVRGLGCSGLSWSSVAEWRPLCAGGKELPPARLLPPPCRQRENVATAANQTLQCFSPDNQLESWERDTK